MSELVAAMQDWRGEALIPSQFIEQVKQLVREKAALETKLEAMERAIEAARNFAASGYVDPQMDWRIPLIEALAHIKEKQQ